MAKSRKELKANTPAKSPYVRLGSLPVGARCMVPDVMAPLTVGPAKEELNPGWSGEIESMCGDRVTVRRTRNTPDAKPERVELTALVMVIPLKS